MASLSIATNAMLQGSTCQAMVPDTAHSGSNVPWTRQICVLTAACLTASAILVGTLALGRAAPETATLEKHPTPPMFGPSRNPGGALRRRSQRKGTPRPSFLPLTLSLPVRNPSSVPLKQNHLQTSTALYSQQHYVCRHVGSCSSILSVVNKSRQQRFQLSAVRLPCAVLPPS